MDLENLDHLVSNCFRYWTLLGSPVRADRLEAEAGDPLNDWLRDVLVTQSGPAPDTCWPVVVALIDRAPDDRFGAVVAGPLADLLAHHGQQFGDRLVEQTRRDSRFREAMRSIHHWEGVPVSLRERLEALSRTNV